MMLDKTGLEACRICRLEIANGTRKELEAHSCSVCGEQTNLVLYAGEYARGAFCSAACLALYWLRHR